MAPTPTPTTNPKFVVWDTTFYTGKPDLSSFGLKPLTGLLSGSLWPGNADRENPPDPSAASKILQYISASTGVTFLDIENWPLSGNSAEVENSIQKYSLTLQAFRQFSPNLKFGYYGVAPIRDYWDAIKSPSSPEYQSWQKRNDSVASIAAQADILFPSIYTFYPDQNGWRVYAIAQIKEARRIAPGKPVYAFLSPLYAGASGSYLPADYWRMELETVRQYADGVVIWGGFQEHWDDNAAWWVETQIFLKEIGSEK